jgi:AAA domain
MKPIKIPKSDLGYNRKDLPNIKAASMSRFLKWLESEGIDYKKVSVDINKVKPSQGEFNVDIIKSLLKNDIDTNDMPAVMSNDYYIMDGHHRYAAQLNKDPNSKYVVYKIDLPFKELIKKAKESPQALFKGLKDYKTVSKKELQKTEDRVLEIVNSILNEGINDPGIFKAVFMAGGPASGKDFIMKKVLAATPLVEISSDPALAMMLRKAGLSLSMPDSEAEARTVVRGQAKKIAVTKKELAIQNRLGIIINGTGADRFETVELKNRLEALGYETAMIFVNTTDEVSKQRNIERGYKHEAKFKGDRKTFDAKSREEARAMAIKLFNPSAEEMDQLSVKQIGRTVPEDTYNGRAVKWQEAQSNIGYYSKNFKRFLVIDNSIDVRQVDKDARKPIEENWNKVWKFLRSFVAAPVDNRFAKAWIESEKKDRGISDFRQAKASKFGKTFEDIQYGTKEFAQLKEDINHMSVEELKELSTINNKIVSNLAKNRLVGRQK